jgi:hypothetical protein
VKRRHNSSPMRCLVETCEPSERATISAEPEHIVPIGVLGLPTRQSGSNSPIWCVKSRIIAGSGTFMDNAAETRPSGPRAGAS